MQAFFTNMANYIIGNIVHNAPYLSLGIITAAILKVYLKPEKIKKALERRSNFSIPASVAFGAFTPLCACGTMAVIISMLSASIPLGPIMAFLTSSPLMSPDGFIMIAGIIDLRFAIALALSSIVIGLASGYITRVIEKRTGFLSNQIRIKEKPATQKCGCPVAEVIQTEACCAVGDSAALNSVISTAGCACGILKNGNSKKPRLCSCAGLPGIKTDETSVVEGSLVKIQTGYSCDNQARLSSDYESVTLGSKSMIQGSCENDRSGNRMTRNIADVKTNRIKFKIEWRALGDAILNVGVKQILFYYLIFVSIGYFINTLVPASIILALFSPDNIFAIPLAGLIGLPLYVGGESAIPLIKELMNSGASGGAMLAFLITGPGTSAGVIAGISTFFKKRALFLYTAYILFGGIILGYIYELALFLGV